MTIAAMFLASSMQFGLPQGLLSALCWVESKHQTQIIHEHDGHSDSLGICQIKLSTAKQMGFTGTAEDLLDPEVNIHYAAAFLAYQIDRYDEDLFRGITAYNKGCSTGSGHSAYTKKVIAAWQAQSYTWYFQEGMNERRRSTSQQER